MSLIDRITLWKSIQPERVAYVRDDERLTYYELITRAQKARPTSPRVLWGHKEPSMLINILSSLLSRQPYIPIDFSTPIQRVTKIEERVRQACYDILPASTPSQLDLIYIMFTSGSTGEPKGVMISHQNLESFVRWMLAIHDFKPCQEVFLNQAPFSFDLSVMDTYLSLVTGGTLWSLTNDEIRNPVKLFSSLKESDVTIWVSTPSFAQMCLKNFDFDRTMLPSIRKFLFCGEPLLHHTASQLLDRFPSARVFNMYGPTETTVAITSIEITREILDLYDPLPVGSVKPGTMIELIDDEVVICGNSVGVGYLGGEKFQGIYRTGDRGHFIDKLLFIDGRKDRQVKVKGNRIELGDVENNLKRCSGIVAAVAGLTPRGQLVAYVTTSDKELTSSALLHTLRLFIPSYMLPHRIHIRESLPLNSNGKIDHRALFKC